MNAKRIFPFCTNRAALLAAAMIFCLSMVPNTLVRATNTNDNLRAPLRSPLPNKNGEVLSHEDEALYRAIFEAQAKAYWKEADLMIAHLRDKRLVGEVLADRYERQTPPLPDLQAWLANYRDLPQAAAFYRMARKLPQGHNAKLTRPLPLDDLSVGSYDSGISSGFRNKDGVGALALSLPARRTIIGIENTLRQGSPAKAKTLIENALQQGMLTEAALVPLQSRLAASFFYNGNVSQALRLTEVSYMQNDARALWISGLSHFHEGRYAEAGQAMVTLAKRDDLSDSDQAAAAFWAYRALKQDGETRQANHWLNVAASQPRSFYGMLAGSLMGQGNGNAWSWNLPEFDQNATALLAKIPAGSRALALIQIGQTEMAENELLHINPQGRHGLQKAMLAVAEKGHMAALAMKLGSVATNDGGKFYDAALYPVPPWQPREGFRVDRALIYALMRHESHFDPTAVSSQGACGLMQLMPATAERMSGKVSRGRKGECPDQFFDPVTNVGLGQNYVRHLADQPMIGDNLLLLLAAYNGGPGRLSQRSGTERSADPLLFMESLPVQETHDYVQQVLIQYWSYCARLNRPMQSLAQLAHGNWPRFALRDTGVREAANIAPQPMKLADNAF